MEKVSEESRFIHESQNCVCRLSPILCVCVLFLTYLCSGFSFYPLIFEWSIPFQTEPHKVHRLLRISYQKIISYVSNNAYHANKGTRKYNHPYLMREKATELRLERNTDLPINKTS